LNRCLLIASGASFLDLQEMRGARIHAFLELACTPPALKNGPRCNLLNLLAEPVHVNIPQAS
jgi:hypothetical protein